MPVPIDRNDQKIDKTIKEKIINFLKGNKGKAYSIQEIYETINDITVVPNEKPYILIYNLGILTYAITCGFLKGIGVFKSKEVDGISYFFLPDSK